jgi:peptidoglycan/LPS O-acetylase OafA/YrhL
VSTWLQQLRAAEARLLSTVSRVTSSGRIIPVLDGLRFLAIMVVILFHSQGHFLPPDAKPFWLPGGSVFGWAVSRGWFGVQLFFIISGFILAAPFAEQHLCGGRAIRLGSYYKRRVTRLEPPYILNLLILLAVYTGLLGGSLRQLIPHFFAHVGYVHSIVYGDIDQPGYVSVNLPAWTLEIEIQFYVLAPLLSQVFRLRGKLLRRTVLVLAIAAATWLDHTTGGHLRRSLLGQLRYFAIGFLLVELYIVDWKGAPGRTFWWDAPGLLAFAAIPLLLADYWATTLAMPFVLLVAYVAAFRGRIVHAIFSQRWVVAIGAMCYTIYLYHIHLIWWVKWWLEKHLFGPIQIGRPLVAVPQLFVTAAVVVLLCMPLFVWLEKPFMRSGWPSALAACARGLWASARRLRGDLQALVASVWEPGA